MSPDPRTCTEPMPLLSPDAFVHLPALAGKIVEPEKSFFRLSRERMSEFDRLARERGLPPDWRLTDEAREATRAARDGRAIQATCGCLPTVR